MARSKKKGGRSGGSVTAIADAPRKMSQGDYPLLQHAIDLLLKHVAKVRKGLRDLSIPTAQIDSLKTLADEAQSLLRRAQGDSEHEPTKTFSLPANVSAAVRVGVYLHLALLEKIQAQQEKQMVAHPDDTADVIRSLEKLADRLSDQLSLFETSGVNQVTLKVTRPEPEPAAPAKPDDGQGDLGVGDGVKEPGALDEE